MRIHNPAMTSTRKSTLQDNDQFLLRFDEKGDRAMFAELAEQSGRSLNKELTHRLKGSLAVPHDVAKACADLKPVDSLDFAVKLFRRAGLKVVWPESKAED